MVDIGERDSLHIDMGLFALLAAVDIRKQEEGPDTRDFSSGDTVPFEIAVTNIGEVDLVNVLVSDFLFPGLDRAIGALAVGASVAYSGSVIADSTGFVNEACVNGNSSVNGISVTDCDSSEVAIETIPEPTTLALMGLGFAGIGYKRHRSKKAA